MYLYICIYVYIYINTRIHVCIYIYVYICTHVYIHICLLELGAPTEGGDQTKHIYDCQNFKQVFMGVPVTLKHVFTGVPKFPSMVSRE